MNILYVFPGQGSQYEGMGKDICEAFEVAAASAPLGETILYETNQPPLHRLLLAPLEEPGLPVNHGLPKLLIA